MECSDVQYRLSIIKEQCVCICMCMCVSGPSWPIRLALPTCLFCCYHDNANRAKPTPYGCYGNIPFFWLMPVSQVYLPAGNDRWMVGVLCVVSVLEQINQKLWACSRQNKPEPNRSQSCIFILSLRLICRSIANHRLWNSRWIYTSFTLTVTLHLKGSDQYKHDHKWLLTKL